MRFMTVLVTVAMLCVVASPATANLLSNGSWQMGNNTGWTAAGGMVTNGTPGYPGNAPGESDGYVWGSNANWTAAGGNTTQAVAPPMAAASYNVDASVYLKLFDTGGITSSITAELLIDGVVQDTQAISGAAIDTAWELKTLSYVGPVTTDAAIRLTTAINGQDGRDIDIGAPWAWAWADGAVLTITPEPASLLLVLLGLPLLRRRSH